MSTRVVSQEAFDSGQDFVNTKTKPTVETFQQLSILTEILKEMKKMNLYLSALSEKEFQNFDIE